MMEANDMLLWTKLRDCVRVLAQIEFQPEIEEFHLTAAELYTAQRGRRGAEPELGRVVFKTVVMNLG
jgi:hypothetical protein